MVQVCRFHDGGFALHKVVVNGRRYSCWFDKEGRLLDAERVRPDWGAQSVPQRWTNVVRELELLGRLYLPAPADGVTKETADMTDSTTPTLAETLRQAVRDDGRAISAVAIAAGIHPSRLLWFMSGRGLSDRHLDTLAKFFGFELKRTPGKGGQ